MKRFFLLLSLFFVHTLFSLHPDLKEAYELIDRSNEQMHLVNDQIEWFLNYIDTSDETQEEQLKKTDAFKEMQSRHRALEKNIRELKVAFTNLRELAASSASLVAGDHVYQTKMYAYAIEELTTWYTQFIHHRLFPNGWEQMYQNARKTIDSEKF